MINERCDPITMVNGVRINRTTTTKKNVQKNNLYVEEDLYSDPFAKAKAEQTRIIKLIPKACPTDFPWPEEWNWAQYSMCPCQSVIIEKQKRATRKK